MYYDDFTLTDIRLAGTVIKKSATLFSASIEIRFISTKQPAAISVM
jgi:hypothetical protein